MRRRVIPLLALAALLALAVAACGGGGSDESAAAAPATTSTSAAGGEATVLELEADPNGALAFDTTTLEAPAGEVTIEMTNPTSVPHDIALQGNGVDEVGDVVTDGGTSTVTANLQPGTYRYYCSVDSHAADGMEGTLTVS